MKKMIHPFIQCIHDQLCECIRASLCVFIYAGIVTFSILLGVGIHSAGAEAQPLLSVFEALNVVIFKIMDIFIL